MVRRPRRVTLGYILVLFAAFSVAVLAGWTSLASGMDRYAYDWMSRVQPPPARPTDSVVLAFDEESFAATGGQPRIRGALAAALERIAPAKPAVVAVDILLADAGAQPAEDARLAGAFGSVRNLVLATDLIPASGRWENPATPFCARATAIGHVHAAPDPVSRVLPLELSTGRDRRWAMALEAARLRMGGGAITESPDDLEIAGVTIPAKRSDARALYIRYRENVPVISVARVLSDPAAAAEFHDKTVFVGVTAQSAARDRLVTPLERSMSGVEIHAQAYETIVGREFLRPAPLAFVVVLCGLFVAGAGAIFASLSGWKAYASAALLLLAAHIAPHLAFSQGVVLSYLAVVWAAWLSAVSAASWQYFVVRRQLQRSESDRARYQQAIHFVTHEMRSPLTAIQGSSEMMGRYNLSEDKRKQMAQMINAESKRLARMIQTFLDIERLTDGQMELRSEPFELADVVRTCLERARPLAERKGITLETGSLEACALQGDRELMEYAVYNLLTNAIKYSPADTTVTVSAASENGEMRLAVRDEGMGMDEKELKNIGRKFYRTRNAEASGEAGTGIGLSLVNQIVSHHRGRLEVASTPGKGSCFTMVLPVAASPKAISR
jgi:signal transduction histidine kinase